MLEALRNLSRRKLRSALTIFGIAIGIFALSVMGSLSEYLNGSIESGIRYSGDIIRVLPVGGLGPGASVVAESEGEKLKTIEYVKAVSGAAITQIGDGLPSNPFQTKYAIGIDPAITQFFFDEVPLEAGRLIRPGDENGAVIGHNIAAQGDLSVGSKKEIRGVEFEVVGIFAPTQNNQIDDFSVVSLKRIQEINRTPGIVSLFIIVPDEPGNAEEVADIINRNFKEEFFALSPKQAREQVAQGLLIFNIIILAGAALAAIVGGFATINTMIMSVSERTREIGIKKAVGASNFQISREFLLESALIGLLAGLLGVGLGKLATIAINAYTVANVEGLEIFNLTPRLALAAVVFATLLGALAGLIPAISAAKMNVVRALREE